MATKRKPTKKRDPNQITADSRPGEDKDISVARMLLRPTVKASLTIQEFDKSLGELTLPGLVKSLVELTDAAHKGDLARAEAMLVAQAHTLDSIFHSMARRAASNLGHYPEAVDRYLKLALRAQSQARATWETLSTIKNPPMVGYVKQANIAHGHQQVNNAASGQAVETRAGENSNSQNKLLEEKDGEGLDTGTTSAPGQADPAMATVGEVDRTEERGR